MLAQLPTSRYHYLIVCNGIHERNTQVRGLEHHLLIRHHFMDRIVVELLQFR